jgi:hypothetical protein
MAMYADSPAAVCTASLWIVGLGAIIGYFCLVIAKVGLQKQQREVSQTSRRNSPALYFYRFVTDI